MKLPWESATGYAMILVYIGTISAAVGVYPSVFNPVINWISDLGNEILDPTGALIFNIGQGVAAGFLIVFIFGVKKWPIYDHPWRKWLMRVAQFAGIIASFSLVMICIFPETFVLHGFFARLVFVSLDFFTIFSATALFFHDPFHKVIAYFGYAAAASGSPLQHVSGRGVVPIRMDYCHDDISIHCASRHKRAKNRVRRFKGQ